MQGLIDPLNYYGPVVAQYLAKNPGAGWKILKLAGLALGAGTAAEAAYDHWPRGGSASETRDNERFKAYVSDYSVYKKGERERVRKPIGRRLRLRYNRLPKILPTLFPIKLWG
jgi:hypothetical protein